MKINKLNKEKKTTIFETVADFKSWRKHQDNAINFFSKNYSVPGFRKGHAPKSLILSKISKQDIFDRALKPCIDEMYKQLIADKKFIKEEVIEDTPKINIVKLDDNNLDVNFEFENYPEVKVPKCDNIPINFSNYDVAEEEVEKELKRITQKDTMLSKKDTNVVAKGDYVVFDFKGSVDGKYFPGGEANDYQLEIGSGSFIPGFEEKMIGMKLGEKNKISVPFPKDYHEKTLAGKESVFEIKINEIKVAKAPVVNNEFVKSLGVDGVKTIDELKKFIKNQLIKQKENKDRNAQTKVIVDYILENTSVSFLPDSLLKGESDRLLADLRHEAEKTKMTLVEYANEYLNLKSEDEINKKIKENAEKNLKLIMSLNELIKIHKIAVDQEEIEKYIKTLAHMYQKNYKTLKEQLANRMEQIEIQLSQEKLFTTLINLNKK